MLLKYKDFFSILGQWIFFGSIIGIVIGTTTNFLLETNDYLGDDIRAKRDWLIFLLPFGGIIIGYIYMKYGKVFLNNTLNDTAELNNLVIDSVHGKKEVPRRMGPIVFFGTFITILFGGSTGREGAAVQMGGSVAAAVNKFFKVNRFDKKVLIISGISAGFGSAFGAPITGTVFGMEMAALGKLKFEALVPCLVASFVGHYITTAAWGHKHEEFIIQTVPEISSITFLKVILIAVIFSLISVLYCQLRHGIQNFSEKLFKKNHMKRAFFGGIVIVGLTLIVGSQDFNGRGLQMLQQTFSEEVPPFAFLAKLVFTAVTLGSGFVGGEAIPLFFIGATLGNALHTFIDLPMSFLAALGLIAVFCGGANTPIAAFLLAMEMFDGKGLEYFFVACLVSYLFSGYHGLWPSQKIYNPKSRLYNLPQGETLENVKKRKKALNKIDCSERGLLMDFHFIWKAIVVVVGGVIILRLAGRKSISQLTVAQTVMMIAVGSLIIQPVGDRNIWITMVITFLMVITLLFIEYIALKYNVFETFVYGKSLLVVENGQINESNLKKLRLTVDMLEVRMRQENIQHFTDLQWATIEANGQLGYMLKSDKQYATKEDIQMLKSLIESNQSRPQNGSSKTQTIMSDNLFTEVKNRKHKEKPKENLD